MIRWNSEDKPYIHSDGNMQARFIWHPNTPHSADWTYAIVTSACPDADTSMLAFTADVISEGTVFDSLVGTSWLLQAIDDRASINTT
jgi:hypothetical protein